MIKLECQNKGKIKNKKKSSLCTTVGPRNAIWSDENAGMTTQNADIKPRRDKLSLENATLWIYEILSRKFLASKLVKNFGARPHDECQLMCLKRVSINKQRVDGTSIKLGRNLKQEMQLIPLHDIPSSSNLKDLEGW